MNLLTTFEILGALGGTGLAYQAAATHGYGWKYWQLKTPGEKAGHRDAAYVRRTWRRLARHVDLVLRDDMPTFLEDLLRPADAKPKVKIRTPKLLDIKADHHGLTVKFATLPNVGLAEFDRKADHLRNYWGMTRTKVDQPEPRVIRVRAVRTDPLATYMELQNPIKIPESMAFVPMGISDLGRTVSAELKSSTGIGIYGAPRRGKTSLIMGMLTALADREEAVFVIADGKTQTGWEGDYYDMGNRAVAVIGDDLAEFNQLMRAVEAIRVDRQSRIRAELGVPNLWDVGPSKEWPVIVVVIDEAHSYFEQITPASSPDVRAKNALAAENVYLTHRVVKLCGAVGIWFIIGTQRPTVDAVPAAIRANLTQRLCLGVLEESTAIASLGEGIKDYPDAMPTQYMADRYRGCATMRFDESGFIRFRAPFCSPALAARTAKLTSHLVTAQQTRYQLPVGQAHFALAPASPAALTQSEDAETVE